MLKSTPVSSALAALMIASVLSGCGGGKVESSGAPVRSDSQTTADAVAQAAASAATKAAEDAKAAAAPAPDVFKMPNFIGENLQLSQDKLQALGSYFMDQEDASGLGRIQVLDSNWKVCKQDPAPGKMVSVDTIVVLSSVKLSEQCP